MEIGIPRFIRDACRVPSSAETASRYHAPLFAPGKISRVPEVGGIQDAHITVSRTAEKKLKRPLVGAVIAEFGAGSRNRTHDQRFTKRFGPT
jgi:hypothetical protein